VISNSYGALKGAGLFRTLTPRRETTDMVVWVWKSLAGKFPEIEKRAGLNMEVVALW
jgi:hypothetical protein